MGENELEFNYSDALVFEDLETGKKIKVNAKNAKNAYLKAMEENLLEIKNTFLSKNISYELFSLKNPIGEALQLFLKKRIALK